jgi:transposase
MSIPHEFERFWLKHPHSKHISSQIPLPINENIVKIDKSKSKKLHYKFCEYFKIKNAEKIKDEIVYDDYVLPEYDCKPNEKLRTIKVRFYPNTQQKIYLNKCFNMHRLMYNKSIAIINKRYANRKQEFENNPTCVLCKNEKRENDYTCGEHPGVSLPWDLKIYMGSIRPEVMKSDKEIKTNHPELFWQLDVPRNIRDSGISKACDAFSSAVAAKKAGVIDNFRLSFLRKNKPTKYVLFPGNVMTLNKDGIVLCPRKLKNDKLVKINNRKKNIIKQIYKENGGKFNFTTIICNRKNYYFLFTSNTQREDKQKNDKRSDVISLDPGEKVPLAGYVPDKRICVNIGVEVMVKIKKLNLKIDEIKSIFDKVKNKSKKGKKKKYKRRLRGLKNKIQKLEFKISCIKNNFHIYTGVLLARGYKNIILPTFETNDMQTGDTLQSNIKRGLNNIAHYQLKEKIKYFAWKYNSDIQIVEEHYTSKTCPCCGHLNQQKIINRVFKCSRCHTYGPRDFVGAANILIKTFAENTAELY